MERRFYLIHRFALEGDDIPGIENFSMMFWFSVNWSITPFELAYKNGEIHHVQTSKKLHPARKGFYSQTVSG
jgi:hypothetical protein